MAGIKLPKDEIACKPILVTKSQHRTIHSMARRKKMRITVLIDKLLDKIDGISICNTCNNVGCDGVINPDTIVYDCARHKASE